jgi:hypothetical protein
MKKSMKFATALAGAAVVVVGGSAFTDSNTVADSKAGYGQGAVTGLTFTNTSYEVNTLTNTVKTVTFDSAVSVMSGYSFQATLKSGADPGSPEESSVACTPSVVTADTLWRVSCDMDDTTTVAEITYAGLAVWDSNA